MSRFRPPPGPATYADVKEAVLKLTRDVVGLQGKIDRLDLKFRQVGGRPKHVLRADELAAATGSAEQRDPKNLFAQVETHLEIERRFGGAKGEARAGAEVTAIRDTVLALQWNLDGVHRDVAAIKAHMEAIESSSVLRDDFKKWLQP